MPISTQDHIAVERIKSAIREIPDFPKPGILFKDIMPVMKDPVLFNQVVDYFYYQIKDKNVQYISGIESRGFIIGAALAYKLGAGFVPIRKKGKLPGQIEAHHYDLEYGTDTVEIQSDAFPKGARVVLIDDLLATGGTAGAAIHLLERLECEILEILFMVELDFLKGRTALPARIQTHSMIHYA